MIACVALVACGSKREPAHDDTAAATPTSVEDAAHHEEGDATAHATVEPVAPARSEHAVWDLVDNRHAAHRMVDGELVLDASTVALARYTRFGMPSPRWKLGQTVDGTRAAIADRLASLEVPLTVEQARTGVQLTLRVHATDAEQQLELKVNGRRASKDARVALAAGWQTIALAIEPGRLKVGENLLVFETSRVRARGAGRRRARTDRRGFALAWLRLGAARELDEQDPRVASRFDGDARTISLADGAGLTWFVSLPEGAHLVASVAAGCVIDVRARPSADAFAGGMLAGPEARVDLSAMGGKVVALSLVARDCPEATSAKITSPRITIPGHAPEPFPKAPPPRYVVLWVMDALRADKLPAFTPGARAKTPHLDELARSSVVFRQYYVQGNESQTSHASMWTGVYPAVHEVRSAGVGGTWRIADRLDVIAEQLAGAGFATTGVTANGFVTESRGHARGFQVFRNMMREKGVINGVIFGQKVVDVALSQLDAQRATPTYLFLGTIDTHGPWIARKPWVDVYSPGPYDGPFQQYGTAKELGFRPGRMGCSIIPPPPDIERLRAIYDSAISYQDQQLGRFIEQLKSWGIWDETMLVVTADHGEEFFEDGRCGHGGSLRDSLIRVPLLVHDPSRFPGGTIVDEGAEGVDLLPTFLEVVGAPPLPEVQGQSLVALAQGIGRGWARPSYASQYEYAHAMRIGRWKIRVGKSAVPWIADLVADPEESRDVSADRPVERRMLTDQLGMFLALRTQWRKQTWGVVTNVTAAGAAALDEAASP